MKLIPLAQAFEQWQELRPADRDDHPAQAESWNDYTDSLAKDGQLNELQYHYAPAWDDSMPGMGRQWDELADDREYIVGELVPRFRVTRLDARTDAAADEWDKSASHWRCTLTRNGKSMRVQYSMGSAHTEPPDLEGVLGCLLSDAEYAGESFADWCDALDMDTDSRRAERMYKACKRIAAGLARLFTDSELEGLRELYGDA